MSTKGKQAQSGISILQLFFKIKQGLTNTSKPEENSSLDGAVSEPFFVFLDENLCLQCLLKLQKYAVVFVLAWFCAIRPHWVYVAWPRSTGPALSSADVLLQWYLLHFWTVIICLSESRDARCFNGFHKAITIRSLYVMTSKRALAFISQGSLGPPGVPGGDGLKVSSLALTQNSWWF